LPIGIVIGGLSADLRTTATVSNNRIKRFFEGIRIYQTENSTINDNTVRDCRSGIVTNFTNYEARIAASGFTWQGNVLRDNDVYFYDGVGSAVGVALEGDWLVEGGLIWSSPDVTTGAPLMTLRGFDSDADGSDADMGNFVVRGVTFANFDDWAINDSHTASEETLSVFLDQCVFDSAVSGASTKAAYRVYRDTSVDRTIKFGTNIAKGLTGTVLLGTTVGALTENYDFGEWVHADEITTPFRSQIGSGVISGGTPAFNFGPRKIIQQHETVGGGATETISGILPAYAVIHGVNIEAKSNVTTTDGGSPPTALNVGDGSDPDLWGAPSLTAGSWPNTSKTGPGAWTALDKRTGSSAADVVLTLTGGTSPVFDADKSINVVVYYSKLDGDAP
jgi:parallel beta-helix repeat protein